MQDRFFFYKPFYFYLLAVDLKEKANHRLMTWESIQKENLLSAEGKKLRGSDTERLKRMSFKWDLRFVFHDNTIIMLHVEAYLTFPLNSVQRTRLTYCLLTQAEENSQVAVVITYFGVCSITGESQDTGMKPLLFKLTLYV